MMSGISDSAGLASFDGDVALRTSSLRTGGVVPVVPTIFHADESLDLPGLERVVDYLVDSGAEALCLLANYSEQFSLTDAEREQVLRCVVARNAGRRPLVVTTSHFSARVAAIRSREAQAAGAEMVMLMPPFFGATMSTPADEVIGYFRTVAAAIDIPIMLQDAPLSSTALSPELIVRLVREVPAVRYAKIETRGAADTLRVIIDALGGALEGPFDGEEGVTLIPDLHAGAIGTLCSATVPDQLTAIVRRFRDGDRDAATRAWEALLPLLHYENRQCGLRAQKVLLAEGGIIASECTRAPLGRLAEPVREGLLALAARRDPLILRWGR